MKISSNFFQVKGKKGLSVGVWKSLSKYVLLAAALVAIYIIVNTIAKKILHLYS